MTELKIPIGNEIRENRCGIIRAYEINGPWNRLDIIFRSNFLIYIFNYLQNSNFDTSRDTKKSICSDSR